MNGHRKICVLILTCLLFLISNCYACLKDPTAVISEPSDPYVICVGDAIDFNGSTSHDNDENECCIEGYEWEFGDGGTGTGATPSHTYFEASPPEGYNVRLRVQDDEGEWSDYETCTVYVVEVQSLLPDEGTEMDDGDGDPDTKSFVVCIADTGVVTVTATPNPSVSEEDLPNCWTLEGGNVQDKLHTEVDKTTASTKVITCTAGSSSKTTTIHIIDGLTVFPREAYVCVSGTKEFAAWRCVDDIATDVTSSATFSTDNTNGLMKRNGESTGPNNKILHPGSVSASEGADRVKARWGGGEWTDDDHDCDLTVVEVDYLTVTGATQTNVTGVKNWAAVKDPTGEVIITATLDPDVGEDNVPEGFTWDGGSFVEGHPLQRKVSKSTSAKTRVTATCCSSSDYVDIWILWATVEIKMTGTTPANAVQFGSARDGTENLGAISYPGLMGQWLAAGKVVGIGTITPSGVHDVVKDGWGFKRYKWRHYFKDGVKWTDRWDTYWTDDTSYWYWLVLTPDPIDQIFDTDAPTIGQWMGVTDSAESYLNLRQWVEWNEEVASDQYTYWYWQGRWKDGATPEEITLKDVGPGNITLPGEDDAYYPPP